MIRESKAALREMLAAKDFEGIARLAGSKPGVTRALTSLLYDEDQLLCARAAKALGMAASVIASRAPERVRNLIRSLLWSMNDESGGICWHAPEAIGEILANVSTLRDEFVPILMSFIDESPFERGVHRAAYRICRSDPKAMTQHITRLARSLRDPDPAIRGHAAQTLGLSGSASQIHVLRSMNADAAAFACFDDGSSEFVQLRVGEIAADAMSRLERSSR